MDVVTIPAHFDGEQIRLDEPYELKSNDKLLVTILQGEDAEREEWLGFSESALAPAYADDEIEYSLDLIKEANPEYEGR